MLRKKWAEVIYCVTALIFFLKLLFFFKIILYLFVSCAILDSEGIYLFTHSCQDWESSSRLVPGLRKLRVY